MKKETQKAAVLLALLLTAAAALLGFAAPARQGAKDGLDLAESTVLPSLLPLLMLFLLIQNTKAGQLLCRGLTVPAKLLRLPAAAAGALLFGQIGGYPTGAVLTDALLAQGQITKDVARRLLCLNLCGGMGFICTAIGTAVLGNSAAGWLLLLSDICANLTLALLTLPFTQRHRSAAESSVPPLFLGDALPAAAKSATESLLQLSAWIILFSALAAVVPVPKLLLPLFEITAGLCTGTAYTLPQMAAFLAFGGVCVHLQLLGYMGRCGLSYFTFLAARACAALLADGYCRIWLRLFPQAAAVFSNGVQALPRSGVGNKAFTVLLLTGALVFAMDLLQRRRRLAWI